MERLEQQSGVTLKSGSPLLAWLIEQCCNLLLLFDKGEPHHGQTACMRLKGELWRVELPNFGECVDYRKRTRHMLESRWSRGAFVGVRVKTTERIVMDETGTYVVQSVRRVPEEQRYDHRLLHSVRGTPWEPNRSDFSADLAEPMLIIHNCQMLNLLRPTPITVNTEELALSTSAKNGPRKVLLHGGMPSLRSSPRRIANVWAGTHRRVQEATWRRNDNESKQHV